MTISEKLRHGLIFIVLLGGLGVLGFQQGRMIHALHHPKSEADRKIAAEVEKARLGQRITIPIPARPGNIYARSGSSWVLVAGSRQTPSCYVDPKFLLENYETVEIRQLAGSLAEILNENPGELYETIIADPHKRFLWLSRELSNDQAEKIAALENRAIGIQYEWKREYPNGPLASTVVGFRRKDGTAGVGLEAELDSILKATDGKRVVLGDAGRRGIWADIAETHLPRDGGNVFLSIDLQIQEFLQEAVTRTVADYEAQWGTGIVINPWTGEILAMCSYPNFDPNYYNEAEIEKMANKCISSPYEPGSVFKPIIASTAVDMGLVNYGTKIFCENGVYHARRGGRITDHGHSYANLTVAMGLIKSSNILLAKLGEKFGNKGLYDVVEKWGFGQKTNIDLPQESPGIVRDLHKWDGYSTRRVPFGQEIAATSLQLISAYAAIANGGELLRPQLVMTITSPDGKTLYQAKPEKVRRVLSHKTADQTLDVLSRVITEGTGKKAALKNYTSWGKTGTAQVPGPQGYMEGAYTASFIGGAPVRNTSVICLISIYRPDRYKGYYGGTVAAPCVAEVLEKTLLYLDVPPDKNTGETTGTIDNEDISD